MDPEVPESSLERMFTTSAVRLFEYFADVKEIELKRNLERLFGLVLCH